MSKRTVLGRFVGPPDETLKQIGMVIVMAARLDHLGMQMLEATTGVPVQDAANLPPRLLTKRLKDSVQRKPLNRLETQLNEWLRNVNDLLEIRHWLAHAETYYEVRGDGRRGHFMMRPEQVIDRLDDATSDGMRLMMDLGTLAHDEAQYDANLKVHAQVEAAWAEMAAEAERLREANR